MAANKPSGQPYISVVIGARNDDHGGNLLGRLEASIEAWVGLTKRYGLASEIVIVEWNPPADRARLIDALRLPSDPSPCDIRFIEVPAELHARFQNSEAVPLHQMIAKNVGIRRARGEFVLAANLDIVYSAELVEFFAERRLERGKMYRIDRIDVASNIPPRSGVDELLAFCDSHRLHIFSAEGFSRLGPDGLRQLEQHDVASSTSGLRLGGGWYEMQDDRGQRYRWLAPEAEILFTKPAGTFRLVIDAETGPSAAGGPVAVEVFDRQGRLLASTSAQGRCTLLLYIPEQVDSGLLRLRASGAGVAIALDARILTLRVFSMKWEHVGEDDWPYPRHQANIRLNFSDPGQVQIGVDQGSAPMLENIEVRVGDGAAPVVFSGPDKPSEPLQVTLGHSGSSLDVRLGFNLSASLPAAQASNWFLEVVGAGQSTDWASRLDAPSPFANFMRQPVYLHTIASGDFTLLSRDDWFALRGYPEFTTWPMHIDALFCYSAHYAGMEEVVLREPLRIYHVQHFSGAGWTPEGERERNARVEAKGVNQMPYYELVKWIDLMRRFNRPFIFCRENWGLGDEQLHETAAVAR